MSRTFALLLTATVFATQATTPRAQDGGVNTVGRAVAKRMAALGRLPAPATIVVADLINYHRHGIPSPKAGERVALDLRWDASLPAGFGESVLQIGMATSRVHDAAHLAPLDLAIVVDRSGSMADADKMSRVKQSLTRFVRRLRPTDRLAIVAYSNSAAVVLPSAPVGTGREACRAITALEPGGSTNLHAGLMLGYREVEEQRSAEAARRVILLTDGIANEGTTDPRAIAADSRRYNEQGIDLSTIGVGTDFNHALLDRLAKAGRGSFHFVADEKDIEKVFVDEAQSLMGMVARNVTLELEHGDDVEIAHVYGHDVQRGDHGFRVPLDDFNYGMTRVVLVKFRAADRRRRIDPPSIEVRLSFDRAADGTRGHREDRGSRESLTERTRFLDPTQGAADHEVRKNFTIAVMARGLRRMAESAKAKRFGEADRYLRIALDYARQQYPDTRDEDLSAIRSMVEKYQKILANHIEAYRDL